jgi:hypothetical protein
MVRPLGAAGRRGLVAVHSRVNNDRRFSCRWLAVSLALLLVSLQAAACNSSSIKLYPVHGKVLFRDQPVEGAQVVFQPVEGATAERPMAYATVAADGSFALRTEPHGEGATAGDFNVMIIWNGVDPRDPEARISKLPAKYADSSKPLLKATVKATQNELEPFKLN